MPWDSHGNLTAARADWLRELPCLVLRRIAASSGSHGTAPIAYQTKPGLSTNWYVSPFFEVLFLRSRGGEMGAGRVMKDTHS